MLKNRSIKNGRQRLPLNPLLLKKVPHPNVIFAIWQCCRILLVHGLCLLAYCWAGQIVAHLEWLQVVVAGPHAGSTEHLLGNYYGSIAGHITSPFEALQVCAELDARFTGSSYCFHACCSNMCSATQTGNLNLHVYVTLRSLPYVSISFILIGIEAARLEAILWHLKHITLCMRSGAYQMGT